MEVCNICHQEIKPDQKYKDYIFTGKVHLVCYNKAFHILIPTLPITMFVMMIGIVLLALGAAGVCSGWDVTGFLATSGDTAMFVIGIIMLALGLGFLISIPVRYFKIKKNPPLDK